MIEGDGEFLEDITFNERAMVEILRYESILSAINDMLVIIDSDLKILYQNDICRRKFGNHTGEYCYRVFEGKDKECDDCPVKRSFKDYMTYSCERMRGSGIDAKYFEIKGSAFRDPVSNIINGVEIVRDITGYKLIQRSLSSRERQQTAIAEIEYDALTGFELDVLMDVSASLIIHTLGIDRCLILENKREGFVFRAGIGWNKNGFEKPFNDPIMCSTLLLEEPIIVEDIRNNTRFRSPLLEENSINSCICVRIGERKNPFGVMSIQSANARKFTDDEVHFLQMASNVLAEAIKHKAAENALKLAKEQAENASMVKTRFLFTVGHELRTPLNSILGFSELLKQKISGDLNEKQEQYLNNILNNGKNLLKMIDNILEVTKMDKEVVTLEKIRISTTIDEVLGQLKEKTVLHNIIIIKEVDPELEFISADLQKFKNVLSHLIENAGKFNSVGGQIIIRTKKEEKMARISISDTGIGIKEENIKRLFRGFEQLDSSLSRKYGGMGIGLLISKQIVEQHGGRFEVESVFGKGSTFSFLLPLNDF